MFASHALRASYNHYMLSTPDIKRRACASFEGATRHPSPSYLRGGPAGWQALCHRTRSFHASCVLPTAHLRLVGFARRGRHGRRCLGDCYNSELFLKILNFFLTIFCCQKRTKIGTGIYFLPV